MTIEDWSGNRNQDGFDEALQLVARRRRKGDALGEESTVTEAARRRADDIQSALAPLLEGLNQAQDIKDMSREPSRDSY
ncbi:hypothetical protein [Nocardia cyriacigeorgica]|uniref:hypothetical protein n=1 Tax=Nocardia cyriacigeorgica TaxID=135487 RepID=UPI002456ECB3|nr:hypothetical protein [Nocardia cyriacigeorgica]